MTSNLRLPSHLLAPPTRRMTLHQLLQIRPTRPDLPDLPDLPSALDELRTVLQHQLLNDAEIQDRQDPREVEVRPGAAPDRVIVRLGERVQLLIGPVQGTYQAGGAMLDFSMPASRRLLLAALDGRSEYRPDPQERPAIRSILARLMPLLPEQADLTTSRLDPTRTPLRTAPGTLFLEVQHPGSRLWLLLQPEGPDGETVTLYAGVHRLCAATDAGDVTGLTAETLRALRLSLQEGFLPLGHLYSSDGLKFATPRLPGSVRPEYYRPTWSAEPAEMPEPCDEGEALGEDARY